jgi:DinB superfamily
MPTKKQARAANTDAALRKQLVELLSSHNAHADFEAAVADLGPELRGRKASGSPFTAWQLLEHLRIAQSDILEFSRDAKHVSPKWPEGYWPKSEAPPDAKAWDRSVKAFRADLDAMKKLVSDPAVDLFARIPHGTGQTILREALLVADHNAYHIGQLVLVRKLLGAWKG